MTCEERQDLIFLYVADALDADELQKLREHLATGCPTCAGYLAEAQATFATMPLALEKLAPPPALKQRLMDRIAAHEASRAPSAKAVDSDRLPDTALLRFFRALIPAGIAAALAIIVTHAVLSERFNKVQRQSDALQSLLQISTQQIDLLRSQLDNQKQVMQMLASPQLKLVQLDGGKLQPAALARLIWDQQGNQWLLMTNGMTPAPAGKTYELWYITADAKKVRAGTFDVDAKGAATLQTTIPPNLGRLTLAAVTDEPRGGSDAPTGNIQLSAKLQ